MDDLRKVVIPGSKLSIAAASFSLYAFETSRISANKSIFNLFGSNMDKIYESIVRTAGAANASADAFYNNASETKQSKSTIKTILYKVNKIKKAN